MTDLNPATIRGHWFDYREFCIKISSVERWVELGMDFHLDSFTKIMRGCGHDLTTRQVLEAMMHMD